ncbi:LANO_0B02784g1_1 [Lachancea nothofagi CBS 11611]|uniref:LANO_0B02784g1_1 n=1 Tax=Lachancea nothofagi CBS 11611 TaxID=1266666 RepID=A0A1G4IW92_9SACH|nr:LANO_0B02784g1_1 [Lachancea nothofagi CBS 11611]
MDKLEELLKDFKDLAEKDAQIKYSVNAIKRYKTSDYTDVDDERKSRHKRNIITVDDNLKINYEMVKTAPGTFIESSVSATKNKAVKEKAGRVAKMKTNYYKKRLYNMNEQFLAEHGTPDQSGSATSSSNSPSVSEGLNWSPEVEGASFEQQLEWLSEMHTELMEQYRYLLQEEKKWFLKKEVMLDANVKLDLYATRDDENGGLQLGNRESSEMCSFPV